MTAWVCAESAAWPPPDWKEPLFERAGALGVP
jgi:hypothetical protein